jgi:hypothetical protein
MTPLHPARSDRGRSRRRWLAGATLLGLLVAVSAAADPRAAAGRTPAAPAERRPPAPAERTPGLAERIEYRDPASPPARGPASALVTIELFFVPSHNLQLGPLRLLQQLQDRHPTRIRLVLRVLKSGSAHLVPTATLEAHAAGKFFEMLEELSRQRIQLKKEELYELARKVGGNAQRTALALEADRYREVLEANQRRFERLHAGGPPSLLFNSRPIKTALGALSAGELDREYEAAYDRAIDKLERGVPLAELPQAFDDEAMAGAPPAVAPTTQSDDDERSPADHRLATPPLRLTGLPSFGKPGVAAAVPVAVLCRPNDTMCTNLLRVLEAETRNYPDEVRVVWAPWFGVERDDAADLTLLGDAALCAESIGSHQNELTPSSGWVWVKEVYAQLGKGSGKRLSADKLIDSVAARLDVDVRALSACRATMASATLDWIAAARRSGVSRATSAIVIGGRIYGGLVDPQMIQQLIAAELAPGVLGSLPRWSTTR